VWPSGSLATRPRGVFHAIPLGGCYVSRRDPSAADSGGRVTPDRGFPPHIPHLRARVSWIQGPRLATSSSHGGNPFSCLLVSGPLRARSGTPYGALDPRIHRAG